MQRALSVNLPMWPIDLLRRRILRMNSDWRRSYDFQPPRPVMLFVMQHGVQVVSHCCQECLAAGVEPGMTLAHARALLEHNECWIEPSDAQREARDLERLAVWATRYSPLVAVDPPDGLLLDITGCQRIFRGERRLAKMIVRDLARLGINARVAIASTFACAQALSAFGHHPISIVNHGEEQQALADLPIGALRIDHSIIQGLHEVEIIRIGQLFDLSRHELAERFDEECLLRLDQASGQALETINPVRLKTALQVQRVFDGPVTQIEAVHCTVRSLLDELSGQLLRLEQGVSRVDLESCRVGAEPVRLRINLSTPSRNVRHLWSLLQPRLETINMGFGVEEIAITASCVGTLPHKQNKCWPDDRQFDDQLICARGELIDTLSNRLGADRVLLLEPVECHLPERSFVARPVMSKLASDNPDREISMADRPTLFLHVPAPVTVETNQGVPTRLNWNGATLPILRCTGTERIAGIWWQTTRANDWESVVRDYFRVQSESGSWMWIYRELPSDQWFIQGIWA